MRQNSRVLNHFVRSISQWHQRLFIGSGSPVALLTALGLLASGVCALSAAAEAIGTLGLDVAAQPVPTPHIYPPAESQVSDASIAAENNRLGDGVYLYGQSQEPDKIGQAYLVFEMRRGKLVGAFYMPSSSFDCVYGTLESQQLALTVVSSYEQTAYSYAVALQERPVASASSSNPTGPEIGLEGFYSLPTLSENDQRILSMCKDNYQQEVWSE